MTTIPSIETATAIPPAPQTAWTPLPAVVDGRMAVLVFAGERTPCAAAPAACPLAEVAAFPAALEAIAAAPLAPSETAPPVASDAGRAVSMKPPQGIPAASAQGLREGAAVSSKPPCHVGVPSSTIFSPLPAPVEVVAGAVVVPDAGRAVSPQPPQGAAAPLPKAADETALADAVVAAGVAPAPPPAAVVAPADAPAVSAVEVVTAAFAPFSARAAEPAQVFVEAARAVAGTLLVTPGLLRGQGEIRIQLRPDVLDGTEIRVAVEGRQLTVAFTPPTAEMAALIEQCRPQLAAHLAERVHAFQVAVDVRRRTRSEEKG